MCQYYRSLYQCGHERLEVTECIQVARYGATHYKPKRCRRPRYVPPVTQPCGCLDGYVLGFLHNRCRYHPAVEVQAQPYKLMEQIYTVPLEELATMTGLEKLGLLVEVGALLREEEEKAGYCCLPVVQEERVSEDEVNVKRWAEVEEEERERQEWDDFDAMTGRDTRMREREREGADWGGLGEFRTHQDLRDDGAGVGMSRKRRFEDYEDDDGGEERERKRADRGDSARPSEGGMGTY